MYVLYVFIHQQTAVADEMRKLNMRISELESTEHMMKESSSSQSEIERQYRQQLQQLELKCTEQKEHIVNLEAICAMQQGESFEETKKELEKNKAVSAQLQVQIAKLQTDLQACDIRYKQVASNLEDAHQKQTDLLEESRAAMTKTMQLTEENAKLHEQNFNLVEDMKSLNAKLQQQGGAAAGLPNDEELNALKKEKARLQRELKVQVHIHIHNIMYASAVHSLRSICSCCVMGAIRSNLYFIPSHHAEAHT